MRSLTVRSEAPTSRGGCRAALAAAGLLLLASTSCQLPREREFPRPEVEVPERWSALVEDGGRSLGRWWREFEDPRLDELVETALRRNLDLAQAWARLDQSRARFRASGAEFVPALDYQANATVEKPLASGLPSDVFIGGSPGNADTRRLRIAPTASYEIDLWGRLRSIRAARAYETAASLEDARATALQLTAQVAEAWLTILENRRLLELLDEQVATDRGLLELIELRFSVGRSDSLDVLRQRQQLARSQSELPQFSSVLEQTRNDLAILLGAAPVDFEAPPGLLSERIVLPPLPRVGSPEELFETRPDLIAARARLEAADHEVAAAVADKLPRLELSLSYDFSATRGGFDFEREILSLGASLVGPLFDGGRRDAEVELREARVRELLDAFGAVYLGVLREIENALVGEKRRAERLTLLEAELDLARDGLREARQRYAGGQGEYLDVLDALRTLRTLERVVVSGRRELLSARVSLYRALGGTWTRTLDAPERDAERKLETMR